MNELGRIELFGGLEPELLQATEARCGAVRASADELIIDFEDPSTDVYVVLSGRVRVLFRTATGKTVIHGELGRGELFGELSAIDGAPRSANVTALHATELRVMPASAFAELLRRSPTFNTRVLELLAGRIRSLNGRIAEHSFLTARHRLYAELLRLSAPRAGHPDQRAISPPPVQHDLANRIGTRREVVSRELSSLARAGLVRKTRGALVIGDPKELSRRISAALEE